MSLIILDRDGVINEDSDEYIKSPEEFQPLAGSLEAIALLKRAGHIVTVATNQSGVARGLFTRFDLEAMHAKLERLLAEKGAQLDGIFVCPHGPDDNCTCRKPLPGLIFQIRDNLKIDLTNAILIGDSYRDIQAARSAGVRPILVRTGKGKRTLEKHGPDLTDVEIFDNLLAVAHYLLNTGK